MRKKKRTRHHIRPKSRGGSNEVSNILMLWETKHRIWHEVFDNRTLEEVIELLIRVKQAKRRQL